MWLLRQLTVGRLAEKTIATSCQVPDVTGWIALYFATGRDVSGLMVFLTFR